MEAKYSSFQFKSFRIPSFCFNEPKNPETTIQLQFIPSGKYLQQEGIFELNLRLIGTAEDNEQAEIINITLIALFQFEVDLPFNEIPSYFYKNSIAIVFPYIRSFISTLTLQANSGIIMLSVMNLSNLEVPLIKNTVVV